MFLHRISSLQAFKLARLRRVIGLFRITLECALLGIAFTGIAVAQYPGQINTSKRSNNPRAVAVVEFTGDAAKPTASRLVPVSYFYAGEYQDAGIYMAQPAPVALLSDTEYEMEHEGNAAGFYDVETAGRIADAWIGFGDIKPLNTEKPKRSGTAVSDDEGRPHFAKSATPSGPEPPAVDQKKPASDETATATNASPLDESDRPTLKRRATPIGQQQAIPDSAPAGINDPDRPRMKRTQAAQERPGGKHLVNSPPDMHQMVAVSDATTREPHPFAYTWSSAADEVNAKQKLTAAVEATLAPTAAAPGVSVARKGSRRTGVVKTATGPTLKDVHVSSFALTYENTPVLVLSAHTDEATPRLVTVIAEVDIYNEPRILLSSTTDAEHRGDTPEMHLIDAVDADGSNRASLLFELRGATDRQFALYRVTRGVTERTFVTGSVPYAPPVPAAMP
jgi:hypothetical protein